MEVVHHADHGAVFPPLSHTFVVLFYYTLLQSLAKVTATLMKVEGRYMYRYSNLMTQSSIILHVIIKKVISHTQSPIIISKTIIVLLIGPY